MADDENKPKPAPPAPSTGPKAGEGLFGTISALLSGANKAAGPSVAPAVAHQDPTHPAVQKESTPETRFANLTSAMSEIEPIRIDVPEKIAPAAPKPAPQSLAQKRAAATPSVLTTPAPAAAPKPAPKPAAPVSPSDARRDARAADKPPLALKPKPPEYVDDLRARAEAEEISGGIVHRRYLLGNESPSQTLREDRRGGDDSSSSSSRSGGYSRRGSESSDELSAIVSDVMPQIKSGADADRYKKSVGLLSDPSAAGGDSKGDVKAALGGKTSVDLLSGGGKGNDDLNALLGLTGSSSVGGSLGSGSSSSSGSSGSSSGMSNSLMDKLSSVSDSKTTLLDQAKKNPEPGLQPQPAAGSAPAERPVFCPYCGNAISAKTAAKVTDKGATIEYVCAHCGESVEVKKPAATPPAAPA